MKLVFLLLGTSGLGSVPHHGQITPQAAILSQLPRVLRSTRHEKSLRPHLPFANSCGNELLRTSYASNLSTTDRDQMEIFWCESMGWDFS